MSVFNSAHPQFAVTVGYADDTTWKTGGDMGLELRV